MPRVILFDINAKEPRKSMEFYKTVFGWRFQKIEGTTHHQWLIHTGPTTEEGINGRISVRHHGDENAVNTILVKSVDKILEKIVKEGGRIVAHKKSLPGIGWIATFRDPEGTVFNVMEEDPKAR